MDEPKPARPEAAAASTAVPPAPAAPAVDVPASTAAALDELTDVTEQARDPRAARGAHDLVDTARRDRILYTLLATFVAHLVLRTWWIGLVGIHTVFPGGPRWERLRYGPAALASYREELPTVPRLLVRADVLASVVFGTGIAVAAVFEELRLPGSERQLRRHVIRFWR